MFCKCMIPVLCLLAIKSVSGISVSNQFNSAITVCGIECEKKFAESPHKVVKACTKGCRLFPTLAMFKDVHETHIMNKTVKLCETACSEAYSNETLEACNYACSTYPTCKGSEKELESIRKILMKLYLKSDSLAHTAKQFLKGNIAVFLNQQTGKFYIIESGGETVEISTNDEVTLKDPKSDMKLGWMECISHQAGIPRWMLVVFLLISVAALMWLCLATVVSAPSQYITASKKDMGYILICEPNSDNLVKSSSNSVYIDDDDEAPPLPPKISLI